MARKPSSSKSSSAKPPGDAEGAVIDAALTLAAERSWHDLALADIAAAANIGLIDLYRGFRSKPAILGAFSRRIDAATLDLPVEPDASARDRLFELVMHRFDLLAPYKPGLKGLARDARRGRFDGLALACHLPRSLAWMLEASGVSASGLKGKVRVKLLGLVYLAALRAWLQDDSPDLAKTMAVLDKALKRAVPFMRLDQTPAAASGDEAMA
ncbi:MAG: transcriptional regulator, TetR family protein [Rhodospirillales bacterium]|nr:transcriptional regulator, TetR family protein [Rhodospirillales bacterium]